MGMEHSSAVVVGFAVDRDYFLMPFKATRPERSHMEDRYHQSTGRKLAPVKVVDAEEQEVYVLDGVEYDDDEGLIDAISKVVGCAISKHGDYCSDEDMMFAVEPKAAADGDLPISFKQVADMAPECERIKREFKKRFGIDLGFAGVHSLDSYS